MPFGVENLEWFGYPTVKKNEETITRFDRVHESGRNCYGTDGQWLRDHVVIIARWQHHAVWYVATIITCPLVFKRLTLRY